MLNKRAIDATLDYEKLRYAETDGLPTIESVLPEHSEISRMQADDDFVRSQVLYWDFMRCLDRQLEPSDIAELELPSTTPIRAFHDDFVRNGTNYRLN